MKKRILFIVLVVAVLLTVAVFKKLIIKSSVPVDSIAIIQFERDGLLESHKTTLDESAILREILSGNFEYRENYSCGFSPDLAITIGGKDFYIASDGCSIIFDVYSNRFFKIKREQKQVISEVFAKYGGTVF